MIGVGLPDKQDKMKKCHRSIALSGHPIRNDMAVRE